MTTTAAPTSTAPAGPRAPLGTDPRADPGVTEHGLPHRWGVGLLAGLLLGALALRLVLWARASGFEQGDPVEYVNIAYKIAFGIGIPWWDLRPLLLSLLYVPVLLLAQWWPDPSGEAMVRALRLVGVAFSVGAVGLVYLLGRRLGGELTGLASGLLVAVNPVFNRLSVSTFAEVPSTFFVLLTVWVLVCRPRRALLAGLALGTACMIRYQAIAFLAPIGVWALLDGPRAKDPGRASTLGPGSLALGPSPAVGLAGGLALAGLLHAAVETIAYGRPFHSLLVSFEYNVASGAAAADFGTEPFAWFALGAPEWFGSLPLLLALFGLAPLWRGPRAAEWRLVGLTGATMFLALSALPHKEMRFMTQVSPLLALFAGHGLVRVGGWLGTVAGARSSPLAGWDGAAVRASLAALALAAAGPLLWSSLRLELAQNVGYADGPKLAAQVKPGGTMGTIPWFVARPYTGTRLVLERMDRNRWADQDYVARTVERCDFLLFPEYWLAEDPYVRRLVDGGFRRLESYPNGVVLYQKRGDEPTRRRPRS